SPVGTYPITVSGGVASNYVFSYVSGTLTITPAALTITANNQTRPYGQANPTLTVSYSGFVAGDNQTNLTTPPNVITTALPSSLVGTYPITASGAVDANYTISYIPGILTVAPATLTITPDNQTRPYGSPNPTLTVSYAGFVNGDTPASLTTPPTATTTATQASTIGSYIISATGASDPNYNIVYNTGTLTV